MKNLFLAIVAWIAITVSTQIGAFAQVGASANRWHCEGGSTMRNFVSQGFAPVDQLVKDWSYSPKLKLCAPPLVWDQHIAVLESRPKGRARINILDVDTGSLVMKSPDFSCLSQSRFAMWGRTFVVQSGEQEITLWRMGYTRVSRARRLKTKTKIQDFLFAKNSLVVSCFGQLVAYEASTMKVVWQVSKNFYGSIAAYGGIIFATQELSEFPHLGAYDAATGDMVGELPLSGPRSESKSASSIRVSDKLVQVDLGGTASSRVTPSFNSVVLSYRMKKKAGKTHVEFIIRGEVTSRSPALVYGSELLFLGDLDNFRDSLIRYDFPKNRFDAVMTAEDRPKLFGPTFSNTVLVGNTFWAEDCAFRIGQGKLLRQGGSADRLAPIPVKNGLLFQDKLSDKFSVMRSKAHVSSLDGTWIGRTKQTISQGRAVFRTGKILTGDFNLDVSGKKLAQVRSNGKEKKLDLNGLLLIESQTQEVLAAPNRNALLFAWKKLEDQDFIKLSVELANMSFASQDPDFIAGLIEEAANRGASDKDTSKATKKLVKLRRAKKKPSVKEKKKALVFERKKVEKTKIYERLWKRFQGLPNDTSQDFKVEVLRHFFRRVPQHKEASQLVNSWLPETLRKDELKDPNSWLDFLVAAKQTKISIVRPPVANAKETTFDERQLGATQHTWRKDIVGVRSDRLFVMTPLTNPSQVARCLALGETVCDALDKIFESGKRKRAKSRPLVIHLFASRKYFVEYAASRGMGDVSHALGFYTPRQNITRLFFPDSEDELEEMRGTFVHELTHHWISELCPLFGAQDAARFTHANMGAWIVEGFAEMISEALYDPKRRTFEFQNPRAFTLYVVANANITQLIPWDNFLQLSYLHLKRLSPQPMKNLVVKLHWGIGKAAVQSPKNVFYSQSGALCHFLMRAEDGRYQQALIDYIGLFYQGKSKEWDLNAALGMTPRQLGRRVREFAAKEIRRGL